MNQYYVTSCSTAHYKRLTVKGSNTSISEMFIKSQDCDIITHTANHQDQGAAPHNLDFLPHHNNSHALTHSVHGERGLTEAKAFPKVSPGVGTTPGPGEWWLVNRDGLAGLDVGITAEVTGVRLPGPGTEAPCWPGPEGPVDGAPPEPRKLDIGGRLLLGTGMGGTTSGTGPGPEGGWEGAWLAAGGTPGDIAP